MAPALEVAKFLINSLTLDNLKLQKLLYYSQAVHLVLQGKVCLFPEPIEAWDYGPVVPIVYHNYRSCGFDTIPVSNGSSALKPKERESINIAIEIYGGMSGPELIDQTHYERPWRNAYRPGRPSNIISIDSMYEYFKENLDLPEKKSYISDSKIIKTRFFKDLKEVVDRLIPQNDDVSYSENPFVDVETIAKKNGIDIKRVPSKEILDKHAILHEAVIYVNEGDNPEKQRFSIAHEIFHFLTMWPRGDLIQAVARQGETWKKKNAGSAEAVEEEITDYFAANLLIPTERFVLWEDKTDEEIANAFGVEPKCIRKRREEIEYELVLMTPKNLSSGIRLEEQVPVLLD